MSWRFARSTWWVSSTVRRNCPLRSPKMFIVEKQGYRTSSVALCTDRQAIDTYYSNKSPQYSMSNNSISPHDHGSLPPSRQVSVKRVVSREILNLEATIVDYMFPAVPSMRWRPNPLASADSASSSLFSRRKIRRKYRAKSILTPRVYPSELVRDSFLLIQYGINLIT